MLSASEIGEYVFCPEAWYLRRRGVRQAAPSVERLAAGAERHRVIGAQTDTVAALDRGRRLVAMAVAVLVALAVLLLALSGAQPVTR